MEGELDHPRLRRRLSSICMDRGDWIPECNDGLNLLIVVAGMVFFLWILGKDNVIDQREFFSYRRFWRSCEKENISSTVLLV